MFALQLSLAAASSPPTRLTLRTQFMSPVGRQEYLVNHTVVPFVPHQTAIVVVDMWDKHWCASATTRVAELATPMQQYVAAARAAGVTIVWAPSDVTSYYANSTARRNTLALPNAVLPPAMHVAGRPLPLSTATDGGCDTPCPERKAWTRQIATLLINPSDFLITSNESGAVPAGLQELWNVLASRGISRLLYVGVHENMCILDRPFAIKAMRERGWSADSISVVRELVDVRGARVSFPPPSASR